MKKENKVYFNKCMTIELTKKEFEKKGSKWILITESTEVITPEEYNNIVSAKKFFINLGGYESHKKNYTCNGYIVKNINSISPYKEYKITKDFNIIFNR